MRLLIRLQLLPKWLEVDCIKELGEGNRSWRKMAPLIKLTLTKIMGLCTDLNLALVGSEQLLDSAWKCAYGLWHSHLLLLRPSLSWREVSAYIDSTHTRVINTNGFYKYHWDKGHLNMERQKVI
jgi:hypothetical protein